MKQRTVQWDEATLEELKMFAAQVLGMSVHPKIGEDKLRGKIRMAYPGDTITIMALDDEDSAPADAPVAASAEPTDGKALRGSSAAGDPMVTITIAETDSAGGKRPVFVGVNGVGMLIPRGKQVDIPYRFYLALTHAIKTTYEQDEATGEIISSDVPSYPFGVNKMPPQADIDAYTAAEHVAA